jgi:hypothetical protein
LPCTKNQNSLTATAGGGFDYDLDAVPVIALWGSGSAPPLLRNRHLSRFLLEEHVLDAFAGSTRRTDGCVRREGEGGCGEVPGWGLVLRGGIHTPGHVDYDAVSAADENEDGDKMEREPHWELANRVYHSPLGTTFLLSASSVPHSHTPLPLPSGSS